MPLLSTSDYPAIRAAIDIGLAAADLPDAIIGLDLYAGAAQREVLARDPLAESRTGSALLAVREAAQLLTAARLVPAVPRIVSLSGAGEGITQKLSDPAALAADLRTRAEAAITAVLIAAQGARVRPTAFGLAPGRRGQ